MPVLSSCRSSSKRTIRARAPKPYGVGLATPLGIPSWQGGQRNQEPNQQPTGGVVIVRK